MLRYDVEVHLAVNNATGKRQMQVTHDAGGNQSGMFLLTVRVPIPGHKSPVTDSRRAGCVAETHVVT